MAEPQLLNQIRHDHLVEVWEAQWTPERPRILKCVTFTMPYYENGSLHSLLELADRLSLRQKFKIAKQVTMAIHYLHVEQHILHRDIKPGNVFIGEQFEAAYLGDLGSAARMDDRGEADTNGGTRLYRAPELARQQYGIAAEIYSAGFTFLELFGGALDYAQLDNADMARRLEDGRRAVADRHFRLGPAAPSRLERLVVAMSDRDPARRPASAAQVLRNLGSVSFIDWQPPDPDGRREGLWPPSAPTMQLATSERTIRSGPDAGRVELAVHQRIIGTDQWRSMGALSRRIAAGDDRARRATYEAIVALCEKRWPAT
jgi:serine/threonine protein kinase